MRIRQATHASVLALVLFTTVAGVASADEACTGKTKKGCEIPEVPYSAILPAAGIAGAAGFYFLQRRRGARETATEVASNR